ncbi:MAG: hypothetical protein HY279_15045 [Nitrospinae bacterium]|nr:hypothetical protein [Nitrospinota bacterium]
MSMVTPDLIRGEGGSTIHLVRLALLVNLVRYWIAHYQFVNFRTQYLIQPIA